MWTTVMQVTGTVVVFVALWEYNGPWWAYIGLLMTMLVIEKDGEHF